MPGKRRQLDRAGHTGRPETRTAAALGLADVVPATLELYWRRIVSFFRRACSAPS